MSIYIGPFISATPKEGSRSVDSVYAEIDEMNEGLYLHNANVSEGEAEHWLSNDSSLYESEAAVAFRRNVYERGEALFDFNGVDEAGEREKFGSVFGELIANLEKDRDVKVIYGVLYNSH